MMVDTSFGVLIPASLTADVPNLRQKTLKIGQIGRTLAIFRIDEVFVFYDDDPSVEDQEEEAEIITTLLRYMETPQYLRKSLFPYMEKLQYAGLLPPLRTPHHPLQGEKRGVGDFREAVVVDSGEDESLLDLGLPEDGVFKGELEEGSRVSVRLGEKLEGEKRVVDKVEKKNIDEYWGFSVSMSGDIGQILSKGKIDYSIGTSRRGQNLYEAVEGIKKKDANTVTVTFGGPYQGLYEICERQGFDPDDLFDVMVNVIPDQGTETVRSEEALLATFASMNVLLGRK